MNKESFIHGIYPHSDALISAHRGVTKGRVTESEYLAAQNQDLLNTAVLQRDSGIHFIEDGKARWDDIFRPLINSSAEIAEGPLTRWFDTNTFYRKPIIENAPRFNREKFNKHLVKFSGLDQKVTLPSPFTFAKLSEHDSYGSFDATLEAVGDFVGDIIQHLSSQGIAAIQLNESYLPYNGSESSDIESFLKSLQQLGKVGRGDTQLFVHLNFGDGADALKAMDNRDLEIDGVGVDFYKTRLTDVPTNIARPLIAGVINSQASNIENESEIREFVDKVAEHANPSILYLTHSADLEYVSAPIAEQKVRLLGRLSK